MVSHAKVKLIIAYANAPEPLDTLEQEPTHDIPAQDETTNHTSVPMPVITTLSDKDPKKDRTLNSTVDNDTIGTKPITSDPAVSASSAKAEAETYPSTNGSTGAALDNGLSVAKPDATSTNHDISTPPAPVTTADVITKKAATTSPGAAPDPANVPATSSFATTTTTSQSPTVAATGIPPATPAKTPSNAVIGTPASLNSTTMSPPAKSAHSKVATSDTDIRKRKTSFFKKVCMSLSGRRPADGMTDQERVQG